MLVPSAKRTIVRLLLDGFDGISKDSGGAARRPMTVMRASCAARVEEKARVEREGAVRRVGRRRKDILAVVVGLEVRWGG